MQTQTRAKPEPKPEIQCDWKEFTAPDGRKYYYNRVTKESKWQMPEELKRFQAATAGATGKASVQVMLLYVLLLALSQHSN